MVCRLTVQPAVGGQGWAASGPGAGRGGGSPMRLHRGATGLTAAQPSLSPSPTNSSIFLSRPSHSRGGFAPFFFFCFLIFLRKQRCPARTLCPPNRAISVSLSPHPARVPHPVLWLSLQGHEEQSRSCCLHTKWTCQGSGGWGGDGGCAMSPAISTLSLPGGMSFSMTCKTPHPEVHQLCCAVCPPPVSRSPEAG